MDTQPDRETQGKENHRRDAVSPDIDMQSGDEKPDVFSKTAGLGQAYSEATGHPAPPHSIIMGNEAEFQRTIDKIRRAKLLKEHPRLAAWLAENRTNGDIAERDLENLATFDRIAKDATEREKDRRNSVFYQPAAASKTDDERATGQPNSLMYQTAGPTSLQSGSPFTPVTTPVAGSNTDGDVGRTTNPAVSATPPDPAPSDSITPMATAPETASEAGKRADTAAIQPVGPSVSEQKVDLILRIADSGSLDEAGVHQLRTDIQAQSDINSYFALGLATEQLAGMPREKVLFQIKPYLTPEDRRHFASEDLELVKRHDVQLMTVEDLEWSGQSIVETGKGITRGLVKVGGSLVELASSVLEACHAGSPATPYQRRTDAH
ncbi:hypothetical protein [Agrobacterium tumefaciens]|uniref:hypothetical protein n=1 Tax=Agrobacterium tumefaciens TaxID=358 RepID=UPI0021D1B1B9|nr:hypothetical protein [Agrobacterium tumefaciens]UXS01353.1 hypothetical protein FY156_07605 [Agrobacterium tumefaciens]